MSKVRRRLRRYGRWLARSAALGVAALLVAPSLAFAVRTQPTLAVTNAQLWTLVIGSLTPLVGYVLNKYAPWVSEPVKAGVQVALAAAATAIYSAIATHTFGWNAATVELVGSGVVSALVAHKILWVPSQLAGILGSGQNENVVRARARARARR